MDETLAELLTSTGALGVWFSTDGGLLASAVKDPSITPPSLTPIDTETHFATGPRQVFATPIGRASLVIAFDDTSSLGLIRIRVRNVRATLERALT